MRLLALLLFIPFLAFAQKKQITLEDIYKKGIFRADPAASFVTDNSDSIVNGFKINDDKGRMLDSHDHILGPDKKKVLVFTGREAIYRRSTKANVYLFDSNTGRTVRIDSGKLMHTTFSPDGSKLAYVKNNNLYLYDISSNTSKPITTDGKWNSIINGNCDWVYEEEFEFTRAYDWSPKGNYIAYYRFDETNVKEYSITFYDDSYNREYRYKYPKAGEENSKVEIHIYNVNAANDVKAEYEQGDIYIPRIKWTMDDDQLVVFWLNRRQDDLKLLLTKAETGSSSLLYEEKNKYFVEIDDNWRFMKDGKHFLFTSEMNGYRHLYLYSMDGKTKTQLTQGNFEITEVNGIDESNKRIFYTAAWPRPMDRNLFVAEYGGKKPKTTALTEGKAWHKIEFNTANTRFYDAQSDLNSPPVITLKEIIADKKKNLSARLVQLVTDNSRLKEKLAEYEIGKAEFLRIPNNKGDTLNAFMIRPPQFDPSKKYPVLFCNYGGPGSQEVANKLPKYYYWYQYLAEKGFIIMSVDNTGTGYRGEEFKKKTYLQLGKYEIEDQIAAARYIGNFPFVDKNKIGHWGWSYGGFMSSLAITKGADVFSAAIAVAPVTNWRNYDNIYTERYMRKPQENANGYDDNSPINFTRLIKGKYLIIHGTGDDNVLFQNSIQMVKSLVKNNIDFESFYYPDKNHSISGNLDNTTIHIWSKMANWVLRNLGNENTVWPAGERKAF